MGFFVEGPLQLNKNQALNEFNMNHSDHSDAGATGLDLPTIHPSLRTSQVTRFAQR